MLQSRSVPTGREFVRNLQKAREAQANSPEFKKTAKALYKERNRCKTEECLRDWMIKASDTYRKLAGEDSSVTLEQALQNPDISPSDANKPAKAPQTVETIKLPPSPGGLTVLGFLKLGQTTPEEAVAWLKKNHKYTPKDPEVQDLYDKRLEPKFGKLTVMGLPSLIGDLADKSYLAFVGGRLYQVAHDIKESKYKHIRSNLIENTIGWTVCNMTNTILPRREKLGKGYGVQRSGSTKNSCLDSRESTAL